MKAIAVFMLFLAGLVPTHADTTQTWNLTASCESQPLGPACSDPANISATLTTQMVLGSYVDPSGTGVPFTGIEPLITSLVGTYDGQDMSLFTSNDPWLDTLGGVGNFPQMMSFMAGGTTYLLYWDGSAFVDTLSAVPREALSFISVDPIAAVPEPSTLLLLTVPLLLGLMRWAQMSLQKLSAW